MCALCLKESVPGGDLDDEAHRPTGSHRQARVSHRNAREREVLGVEAEAVVSLTGVPLQQLDDLLDPLTLANSRGPEEVADIDNPEAPDLDGRAS